eukprot:176446-Hanusia_phi.AAC.2
MAIRGVTAAHDSVLPSSWSGPSANRVDGRDSGTPSCSGDRTVPAAGRGGPGGAAGSLSDRTVQLAMVIQVLFGSVSDAARHDSSDDHGSDRDRIGPPSPGPARRSLSRQPFGERDSASPKL